MCLRELTATCVSKRTRKRPPPSQDALSSSPVFGTKSSFAHFLYSVTICNVQIALTGTLENTGKENTQLLLSSLPSIRETTTRNGSKDQRLLLFSARPEGGDIHSQRVRQVERGAAVPGPANNTPSVELSSFSYLPTSIQHAPHEDHCVSQLHTR